MLLQDKIAVVTGGAAGLGKAIVQEYLNQGAVVVAVDISAAKLEQLKEETAAGERLFTVTGDVSSKADNESLLDYVYETFGRLDILVNNAGISDGMLPVAEVLDEEWEKVIAINLTGPFLLCRGAVKRMLEREQTGSIINIASASGVGGGRAGAAYVSSKFGLVGLTKNIAYMYGPKNIRCNAICPGYVDTGISGLNVHSSAYGIERVSQGTKLIRAGVPQEIADLAVYLASDKSSLVNGVEILADAGKGAY